MTEMSVFSNDFIYWHRLLFYNCLKEKCNIDFNSSFSKKESNMVIKL